MANYENKGQPGWSPHGEQAPPYSPPNQAGWAPPPPGPAYSQSGQAYQPAQAYNQSGQQYSQPGQQYSQPGPGYGQPTPTAPYYGSGGVIIQQPGPQTVVVLGGCPKCRVGHLEDEFTCCGILCCLLFFPLGLICLFTMRDKRCTNCGSSF